MVGLVPIGALKQRVIKLPEHPCAAVIERPVNKRVKAALYSPVTFIEAFGVIAVPDGQNIVNPCTEDIIILLSGLPDYLYIRSVICAEGHGAVEHELHVSGAARLRARC